MRRILITAILTPILLSLGAVLWLRWLPPPVTSFMLQSPVRPVRYQWVPAARIPEAMRKAAVASEDQLFWTHHGFDLEAIGRAYEHNQRHRKRRGASTISQQTAKNLFLWQGGGYLRKGVEACFTVLIEALWPKSRILEMYLNIAEFGPGVYGVEAASRAYFGKPASRLTPAEAARLVAVLPNPRRWRAANPGPYVQSRAAWILGQIGYAPRRIEEPLEPAEAADTPAAEEPVAPPAPSIEPAGSEAAAAPAANKAPPPEESTPAAPGNAANGTTAPDTTPPAEAPPASTP